MTTKHLRNLVLPGLAVILLALTACTRHATTPPATSEQGEDALSSQRATMEAVQEMLTTQTAQAAEAQTEESETPVPNTPIPTLQIHPTSPIVVTPQGTQPAATATTPAPVVTEHVVKRGEWVYSIARLYDVEPEAIIALNGLVAPYTLVPGQVLKIPAPGSGTPVPAGTPAPGGTTHTVKAGEWVYSIARKYGVTPEAIIQANGLISPYTIYPGMVLTIP
ncbi:MAG: LysM peptidoglycan-binding domain-containing protein [Anaerolineales bacterium]|jgi:LysM repeat protein